MPKKKYCCYY